MPELETLKRDIDLLLRELRECGATGDDRNHLHCAFHSPDESGSLSVFIDKETGCARFKCHKCEATGTIVDARMRRNSCDAKEAIASLISGNGSHAPADPTPATEKKQKHVYQSADEVLKSVADWQWKEGNELADSFTYTNPNNDSVELISMRINKADGRKQFLQAIPHNGGFILQGVDKNAKTPLYRRKEIRDANTVVVCEGEKKADLLLKIGIPATCSPMGAKSAGRADWSPLANKKCIIWRDYDEAGLEYQEAVIEELKRLGNYNVWRIRVETLGLEEGEDVVDYAAMLRNDGSDEGAVEGAIKHVLNNAKRAGTLSAGMTIPELSLYNTDDDPNCLLGKRWICKGGACLVAGQTGIGKSTFAMQAALTWAGGKSFFGIHPIMPLTSMFIQAENDVGDLAEQAQGVLKSGNLEDDIEYYRERVLIFDEDRLAGDEFCKYLEEKVAAYRPDIVWIDPLHAYLGGDINDAQVCSQFLRRGLNPIAHNYGCAMFILHHTKKPQSDVAKTLAMGDYSYFGAGSAELANWPRAIVVLRQLEERDKLGEGYQLIAAKRGKRAGISLSEKPFDGAEQNNQYVILKHAPVGLCWLPREEQAAPEDEQTTALKLDAQIAAEDVYKAMTKDHNYNEKELRELFMTVHGLKKTRRTELYDPKRRWGAAWKILVDSVPVNPQMKWCYMKTSDTLTMVVEKPAEDHSDDQTHDEHSDLPFDDGGLEQ